MRTYPHSRVRSLRWLFALALLGLGIANTSAVAAPLFTTPTPPALPNVFLDTTYTPPSGTSIAAHTSTELQNALNTALPGDEIVLDAGMTYTGNFTLPNNVGTAWIIVRSSALASLPAPGKRVAPHQANFMPKIVSPDTTPALTATNGAHHFRFIGIEFTYDPSVSINYAVIALGTANETITSDLPHHIILDRVYVHGHPNKELRRAVALNSGWAAIIDSWLSEAHQDGFDTHAIGSWNGMGPFKIVNNQLEGAGENILIGGDIPSITNLIASDIEIRCNDLYKPVAWKHSPPNWSIKNSFEIKSARRVLIDQNIFENNWLDSQVGYAILFTVRTENGNAPWIRIQDITFTNNIIKHSGSGVNVSGSDNLDPAMPTHLTQRLKINNNLWYDLNSVPWGGGGILSQIIATVDDVTFEHNTALHSGNIMVMDEIDKKSLRVRVRDNIFPHNQYGVFGSNVGAGTVALDAYFEDWQFDHNVIAAIAPSGYAPSDYPTGNFFPASLNDVGFTDLANHNYALLASSLYHNAASDGTDIGVDMNAISAPCPTQYGGAIPSLPADPAPCGDKPNKPAPIYPINNFKIKANKALLAWEPTHCATNYKFVVRAGSQNGSKVASGKNLTTTRVTLANPLPRGQTFYWQVKACDADNCSKSLWEVFRTK